MREEELSQVALARLLLLQGEMLHRQSQFGEALDYYQQALEIIARVAPRSRNHAACLNNIGEVYRAQGNWAQALPYFQQALAISEQIATDSPLRAICLNNVGTAYFALGDLAQALRSFVKALEIIEQIAPNSKDHATCLNNIGEVHRVQGDWVQALYYLQQALEIDQAIDPHSQETARDLNNIGLVYRAQEDWVQALYYLQQALEIDQAIDPHSQETATELNNIGEVYRAQGNWAQALPYFQQALAISEQIATDSPLRAICLNNVGTAYFALGDLAQALRSFVKALEIIERVDPDSKEHASILSNIGYVYQVKRDLERASQYFEQAIEVVESLRARAGSQRAKEAIFQKYQNPYHALIICLYERNHSGDHAHAFHYAERSRARTMLDLLAERQVEIQPETEAQKQLVEQERNLQPQLAAAHNMLIQLRQNPGTPPEMLRDWEQQAHRLEEQLEQVRDAIRREFPAYAGLEYPEPLTLEAVQQEVLDPSVLLLEYALMDDAAFVWAVRQDGFEMIMLPFTGKELASLVDEAIGKYHSKDVSDEQMAQAQQSLATALIEVVPAEFWQGVSRVIVVPDGALYYLPFEILPLQNGQPLGEAYPIVYAPSATVLHNLRQMLDRRPALDYQGEFVGYGDPLFRDEDDGQDESRTAARRFVQWGIKLSRLPGTRVEVENIAQRFGERATVYLQEQATEHRAKTTVSGYRYVHFATHGLLNNRNPLYSGLALSPPQPDAPEGCDDMLQVWEMFGLKLDAEVVVLSACQTGLGQLRGGEGLVGMSRALFFAGAKSLVVSLWNVPDVETAQLMQWFYEELSQGKSVVEALRAAKARMRAIEPDPFYWAAFIPIGLAW